MDFTVLANNPQLNKIERISVSFFDRWVLKCDGQLSELGRRRFLDALFFALTNAGGRLEVYDRKAGEEIRGGLSELADCLSKCLEAQTNLEVGLSQAIEKQIDFEGLCANFSFLKPVLEKRQFKLFFPGFANYLQKICRKFKEKSKTSEKAQFTEFEEFLKQEIVEDPNKEADSKFKQIYDELNAEVNQFKEKMSQMALFSANDSLEQMRNKLDQKFNSIRLNLQALSNDIRGYSKHSINWKLKDEFEAVQRRISQITDEIYSGKIPEQINSKASAKNPIYFEDQERQNSSPKHKEQAQQEKIADESKPLFSFYRVKSIAKHKKIAKNSKERASKNVSHRSLRTSEYGVSGLSERGSSDSVSYYICDADGNTLSQMDQLSDDLSAKLPRKTQESPSKSIKKNQSTELILAKETIPEKLSLTQLAEENTSEINRNIRDSLAFSINEFKLKGLEMENQALKRTFASFGIDISQFIDKEGSEWRLVREKELLEKLKEVSARERILEEQDAVSESGPELKEEIRILKIKYASALRMAEFLSDNFEVVEQRTTDIAEALRYCKTLIEENKISLADSSDKHKTVLSVARNILRKKIYALKATSENLGDKIREISDFKNEFSKIKHYLAKESKVRNERRLIGNNFSKIIKDIADSLSKIAFSISLSNEEVYRKLATLFKKIKLCQSQVKVERKAFLEQLGALQTENKDLQFINTNMFKELQILSAGQQGFQKEKESLEEQLKLKEEIEEKNRELQVTIQILQEKLDIANSMREMAELKSVGLNEEAEPVHFEKFESKRRTGHEYNPFFRQLGTIDENEELVEASENQEAISIPRETHLASVVDERFKSQEHLQLKAVPVLDIIQIYTLKFNFVLPAQIPVKTTQEKKENPITAEEIKAPLRPRSGSESIDKSKLSKEPELPIDPGVDGQSNENSESSLKLRQNKSGVVGLDKRSSGKKSLFSMENVLRSIGEGNKGDLLSSTPKPIAEFNTAGEGRAHSLRNSRIVFDERSQRPVFEPAEIFFKKSVFKNLNRNNVVFKISQLFKKVNDLSLFLNKGKTQTDHKLQQIKEKLINLELLQTLRKDLLENQQPPLFDTEKINSPHEQIQISLTDRMKLMQSNKDSSPNGPKLFAKPLNQIPQKIETLDIAFPEPADQKLSELRKNYANVALKEKASLTTSDKKQRSEPGKGTKGNQKNLKGLRKTPSNVLASKEKKPEMIFRTTEQQTNDREVFSLPSLVLEQQRLLAPKSPLFKPTPDNFSNAAQNVRNLKPLTPNNPKTNPTSQAEKNLIQNQFVVNKPITEFEILEKSQLRALEEAKSKLEKDLSLASGQIDSLKIDAIRLLGENEVLRDENSERLRILERASSLIKPLVEEAIENEVLLKPEYLDRALEVVCVKFENYETLIGAMDEEIRLLKNELLPSDDVCETGPHGFKPEGPRDSLDPSVEEQVSQKLRDSRKGIKASRSQQKVKGLQENFTEMAVANKKGNNERPVNKIEEQGDSKKIISLKTEKQEKEIPKPENLLFSNKEEQKGVHISLTEMIKRSSTENEQQAEAVPLERKSDEFEKLEGSPIQRRWLVQPPTIEEEPSDDPNTATFTQRQRILKQGFSELLSNISSIIEELRGSLLRALMRVQSSSSEPVFGPRASRQESGTIRSVAPLHMDLEALKEGLLNLKEMMDFLGKNLMLFLEELESIGLENKAAVSVSPQLQELVQENEFLYEKLNESGKQIEELNKKLAELQERLPEARVSLDAKRRSVSMPTLAVESALTWESRFESVNLSQLHDRLRRLVEFKERGYKPTERSALKEEAHRPSAEEKRRNRLGSQRASFNEEQELPDEKNAQTDPANRFDELENFNAFLLNIIRQLKIAVDESGASGRRRLARLEEISRDIDAM